MQDMSWCHNYSILQLSLWMEKAEEEIEKQKLKYLENGKGILCEKTFFIFLRIIGASEIFVLLLSLLQQFFEESYYCGF